jgi:PPK2 family polyphosphate:nucleotide phosphotransferase
MFQAEPHPLLVPFDGTFTIAGAPTQPPASDGRATDREQELDAERKALGKAQHKLFADARFAVLVILQAMDTAGKDGLIRHVFDGVNPTGLHVASFKAPTTLELQHDFLWRTTRELPARGRIAVFNRSYYEEVLVVRVHPEILKAQHLPEHAANEPWDERLRSIVEHERHLATEGTVILKFWLNISKDEQRRRLLKRIEEPSKRWKFSLRDVDERERWLDYMHAYEQCLRATSRPWAPWYAVPADDKKYARWAVASLINGALAKLAIDFPAPTPEQLRDLAEGAKRLARD